MHASTSFGLEVTSNDAIESFQRSLKIEARPDATRELANSYDALLTSIESVTVKPVPTKKERVMPNINIAVLNATGDMAYSVSVQHVSANDVVNWSSETGPFTLTFTGTDSPFNEGLRLQSTTGAAPYTVTGTVKAQPTAGRYYYGVSAVYNVNGRIYTDPGCPEIIVQ